MGDEEPDPVEGAADHAAVGSVPAVRVLEARKDAADQGQATLLRECRAGLARVMAD